MTTPWHFLSLSCWGNLMGIFLLSLTEAQKQLLQLLEITLHAQKSIVISITIQFCDEYAENYSMVRVDFNLQVTNFNALSAIDKK